jgi:hypothetical protein
VQKNALKLSVEAWERLWADLEAKAFQQAQQTAMGEFGRQQQAQQQLASGLGSLAGARQAGQFGLGQAYCRSWWTSTTICSG